MGKLTPEIFNESCCDGGACNIPESAQSCGCDPGCNNYLCERHRLEAELAARQVAPVPEDLPS